MFSTSFYVPPCFPIRPHPAPFTDVPPSFDSHCLGRIPELTLTCAFVFSSDFDVLRGPLSDCLAVPRCSDDVWLMVAWR